jgi:hypothetical protein
MVSIVFTGLEENSMKGKNWKLHSWSAIKMMLIIYALHPPAVLYMDGALNSAHIIYIAGQ